MSKGCKFPRQREEGKASAGKRIANAKPFPGTVISEPPLSQDTLKILSFLRGDQVDLGNPQDPVQVLILGRPEKSKPKE